MNRSMGAALAPAQWRAVAGLCGLVLCLATSAAAQYPDPLIPPPTSPSLPATGTNRLVGIGSAASAGPTGFRLTPSRPYLRSGVWLIDKQLVANGFQTSFEFRIISPGGIVEWSPSGYQRGGDGFAFVIQNFGIPVVGPPAGFLGYHGIPNSLAIEFDTWWNGEPGFGDPNGNHISVHTRGLGANSVSESASLGGTSSIPFLKDGGTHVVRINYLPGSLQVFVDNVTTPVLTIPGLNLANVLQLDNGRAWVGFTAGTGSAYQTHDIRAWQIGPTGFPIAPGGPFPVTASPSMPLPTTPSEPFVLPPPTTTPPATTPPTTGTTNPPFNFPPY